MSKKNTAKKKTKKKDFDKYYYYLKSVQSPETDVEFLYDTFKKVRKKAPTTLIEDFCGTYKITCEWVKLNKNHKAIGIDLDPEPLEYGHKHHYSQLTPDQQKRVQIIKGNVLDPELPKADIVSAQNFSYFIFKERKTLKDYFMNAYRRVKKGGLFICDAFGGPDCMTPNEEETKHEDFSYYWDQDAFDPVTNYGLFYIHFKRKGEKKREKVFTYDWRMWSIPELKDLLLECGFKNVRIFWEEDDEDGDGTGEFSEVTKGEEVEAWVAYLVAEK